MKSNKNELKKLKSENKKLLKTLALKEKQTHKVIDKNIELHNENKALKNETKI